MSKRPYKTTKLRALEGGRDHSREKPEKTLEKEAKPKKKLPIIERDIDEEAKKIWKKLGPKLLKLGLMSEIDAPMFAVLCQIRARLVVIHEFIKAENASLVQETLKPDPDGGVRREYKPSPYVVMEKQYYQLFRMYAREFGLSPLGRTGLTVNIEKKDEGEDLLTK